MRSLRLTAAAVAVPWCIAFSQVKAQIPTAPGVEPDSTALAMDLSTRSRWMHGRQQARFTPFNSESTPLFVDSIRTDGDRRRFFLSIGRTTSGPDSAVVTLDLARRAFEVRIGLAKVPAPPWDVYPGYVVGVELGRRRQRGVAQERVWDLLPSLPSETPRVGLVWRETIEHVCNDGPFRHSLRGTRISRIVRDTVVGGRRMWVVKDSAAVRYEEAYLVHERTVDTTVLESRTGTGTVRGVHVLDNDLHLFRWREDTTRLQGQAVLQYPGGRSFRTPARYEATRRWTLYDARAFQAYVAERRAASMRQSGGMVIVPSNPLDQRLAARDTVARDSLIREWRRASDPDSAQRIFSSLRTFSFRDRQSQAALVRMRIDAGDTVFLYGELSNRAFMTQIDSGDARTMLQFMADPSIPWGFNQSRDALYENLVQGLITMPPAAGGRTDRLACTPVVCRLLADQWRTAREPRLRDVGLVALFTSDPRQWGDTVLALDVKQHPLLASSKMLARGVGASWPAASKAPLPPPGSDAPVWLEWMNGVDPKFKPTGVPSAPPRATPDVRFEWSHIVAIRMYSARTGRDVVSELQQSYRAATSDAARLIFGTMLQGLGGLQLTEADMAAAFTSRVPERVALARGALYTNLGDSAAHMPDAKAAVLVDRLVAAVVNSTPLWSDLMPGPRSSPRGLLPGLHGGSGQILFDTENVPETVRAKWAGQVAFISKSEWEQRNTREGGVLYTVDPVRVWGRFARVYVRLSERISRAANAVPEAYAAGTTYYLMELNGEWVVVSRDAWIT